MFPVQASSSCIFSIPRDRNGIFPETPSAAWQYERLDCVFSYPEEFFTIQISSSTLDNLMAVQPVIITGYSEPATSSTSTVFSVHPYISVGEMLLVFFALLFTFYIIAQAIVKSLSRISTGKKYLQYSGGDVEIRKDI